MAVRGQIQDGGHSKGYNVLKLLSLERNSIETHAMCRFQLNINSFVDTLEIAKNH